MADVKGPDFVALQVRDLQTSAAFYTDRLGLRQAPDSPPGAVVFATEPIPFALREPLVDLDAVDRLGWGIALWMRCDDADRLCDATSSPCTTGKACASSYDPLARSRSRRHDASSKASRPPVTSPSTTMITSTSLSPSSVTGRSSASALARPTASSCSTSTATANHGSSATSWPGSSHSTSRARGSPTSAIVTPSSLTFNRATRGCGPICFWSSYEAAAWAVISHRIRIPQAAKLKQDLAERLGTRADVHGEPVAAFPDPRRLLTLRELRGLSARKVEWLHGVARAALDGRLDSTHLRALPAEHALANLRELPGIGPFSAELVLLRGAGAPDHFPRHERRLQRAMRDLYGLNETRPDELNQIAENWRPYRTWASVLVRVWLEAQDLSGATRRQGGHGRPAQAAPGSSAR